MTDITKFLNDLNVSLQGKDKLIGSLWDRIQAFKVELALLQEQLQEEEFDLYPCLQNVDVEGLTFDEHVEALKFLQKEFDGRFSEIGKMEKVLAIFMTPFSVNVQEAPNSSKLELIRLQHDSLLKDRYYHFQTQGDLLSFYKALKQEEFPRLHDLTQTAQEYLWDIPETFLFIF